MSANWYFAKENKSVGPFAFDDLQKLVTSGMLKPKDLVWNEGSSKWVPAEVVPGLMPEAGAGAPVAVPQMSETDETLSKPDSQQPGDAARRQTSGSDQADTPHQPPITPPTGDQTTASSWRQIVLLFAPLSITSALTGSIIAMLCHAIAGLAVWAFSLSWILGGNLFVVRYFAITATVGAVAAALVLSYQIVIDRTVGVGERCKSLGAIAPGALCVVVLLCLFS